jgi:phage shock protein C
MPRWSDRRAGEPLRLYRDPVHGRLFGVCAGLADYFGVDVRLVRAGTILAGIVFNWFTVIAYAVLAFYLPVKPAELPGGLDDDGFWQKMRVHPAQVLAEIRRRHERLQQRLAILEAEVTSREFALREQFREMR